MKTAEQIQTTINELKTNQSEFIEQLEKANLPMNAAYRHSVKQIQEKIDLLEWVLN